MLRNKLLPGGLLDSYVDFLYLLSLEIKTISALNILNFVVTNSDGNAAVSFTLKFKRVIWKSMLNLQLAVENGTFFGSPGVLDERSCQNKDNDNCK